MDLSKITYEMWISIVVVGLAGIGFLLAIINSIVRLFKSKKQNIKLPKRSQEFLREWDRSHPTFKCPHCGKTFQV